MNCDAIQCVSLLPSIARKEALLAVEESVSIISVVILHCGIGGVPKMLSLSDGEWEEELLSVGEILWEEVGDGETPILIEVVGVELNALVPEEVKVDVELRVILFDREELTVGDTDEISVGETDSVEDTVDVVEEHS